MAVSSPHAAWSVVAQLMSNPVLSISLQGEDEEGETEELVNSVLDEIGIDLNSTLLTAPGRTAAQPVQQVGCCIGCESLETPKFICLDGTI